MEHGGQATSAPFASRGPLPPWERPSPPPPISPDPYLAATVAVLNLSGLGLGYALLRRWIPMAVCLAATGAMLAVVLPVDPDGPPGLVLAGYLAVVGVAVIHGLVRGLESARPPLARQPVALVVSVAILAVPAAGVVGYEETVQRMLLDQLANADRLVQSVKDKPFQTAKPTYHKALRTYAYIASEHPGSRAADRLPQRMRTYYLTVGQPYAKKRYCDAIPPLRDLRNVPNSVDRKFLGNLMTWPDDRLPTSLLDCGTSKLGMVKTVAVRGGDLYDLLSMFPDSAAAKKVGPALTAADARFAGQLSGDAPCSAVEDLQTLDQQVTDLMRHPKVPRDAFRDVDEKIQGHIQSGTYTCGVDEYKDKDFSRARTTMNDFVSTYKDDKRVAMAKKFAIAAEIAEKLPAAGKRLPTTASGGSVRVRFYNDSPDQKQILYTGGATGRVTVPACGHCSTYLSSGMAHTFACSNGRSYPHTTIRLPGGSTYFLQKTIGSGNIKSTAYSFKASPGRSYDYCVYTVQHF